MAKRHFPFSRIFAMKFQFPVESWVNIQQYEFIPIETQSPLQELLGNSYEAVPSHYSGPGLSGRGWSYEHQALSEAQP
jgi:hypothetical protein